jgi:hypothetical protein
LASSAWRTRAASVTAQPTAESGGLSGQ